MKTSDAGWVVAGVLLVLMFTVGAMQQQEQIGRYQLTAVEWLNQNGDRQCIAVLTDTATGKTYWRGRGGRIWGLVPAPTAPGVVELP